MNPWTIAVPGVAVAGAGLAAWGAFVPSSQLFGPTLRGAGGGKNLALTFDDGPNPAITPRLLELLERYNVRATFFLIGRFVRACPELAREIAARGHQIGNHTDTHPHLTWLGAARIAEELRRCQESIVEATGIAARWLRPPYGHRGPQLDGVVRQLGLAGVAMWTRIPGDWNARLAAGLSKRLRRVVGGDNVVLHDGDHRALGGDRQRTLEALEIWLPRWRDAGLKFVTIDEAAGASPRAAEKRNG